LASHEVVTVTVFTVVEVSADAVVSPLAAVKDTATYSGSLSSNNVVSQPHWYRIEAVELTTMREEV
jgi:hypothetical protein